MGSKPAFFELACPGGREVRLHTGDMIKLEEMLPRNAMVRELVSEQKLELSTAEEVRKFLAALVTLDEEMLGAEPYLLSATHPIHGTNTERGLVRELIELLEGSLLALARGAAT